MATPAMMNGHAVALMSQLNFKDAEVILREALTKQGGNQPDIVANLCVCLTALHKPQEAVDKVVR